MSGIDKPRETESWQAGAWETAEQWLLSGCGVSFRSNRNVLKLGSDGFPTEVCQMPPALHTCVLYFISKEKMSRAQPQNFWLHGCGSGPRISLTDFQVLWLVLNHACSNKVADFETPGATDMVKLGGNHRVLLLSTVPCSVERRTPATPPRSRAWHARFSLEKSNEGVNFVAWLDSSWPWRKQEIGW